MNAGKIVQEGSPREIYETPRSRFVAEFVGKSNLFCGIVQRADEQTAEIQTIEGFNIKAFLGAVRNETSPGKRITIYIRPEAIALAPIGDGCSEANRLNGKVAASAYHGSLIEYEVDVHGKSLRARGTNPKGRALFSRGDDVAVVFDPKDVGWISEADEN
jgi:spermidine/putrescine transport system ATP-binding protein